VADLIGTLDVEERERGKDNHTKDHESSAANMVQERNLHASRNFKNKNKVNQGHNPKLKQTTEFKKKIKKKRMMDVLFAGVLSTRLVCVLANL
jgi:hypothetical protein